MGRPGPRMQLINRHIGQRIRARRCSLGLTMAQVADTQGVSYQQMHKYETGVSHVAASRLYELARLFDVSIGYFFQQLSDEAILPPKSASMRFLPLAVVFIGLDEEDQAILVQIARQFAGRRPRSRVQTPNQ